jgi:DNA processing protein
MNAARHAAALARPVMAVPGPVTSVTSEGCHQLIRDQIAVCVTSAADVLAELDRPAST